MAEQNAVGMQQNLDRSCWVCFATDEDDRTAEWVRPCRCRGSTKWVHQTCLQRWVDEKQRGNSTARVACPQCNAEYLIVFPKLGPVVYVLDLADRLISKAGPFAAAGIMVGSIYWTAVTYGAVTVMQVVGHKEGLDVMERADPLFLLIGLPTIPVMLILGKMIRWEDYVLRLWRKYSNKLQILNSFFPGIGCPVPRIPAEDIGRPCGPHGSCVAPWSSPPSQGNSCSAASTQTCRGPGGSKYTYTVNKHDHNCFAHGFDEQDKTLVPKSSPIFKIHHSAPVSVKYCEVMFKFSHNFWQMY
ncbi:E3 ubiquitin-protein ligase MARCH5 isoform X1 [Haplochromis burtoni]|uniref:E3 ubiquitin-protein ligase MARCH5 isoform X1 n=1 Tax=Haplochromis burtoni TaxID=8153 RepID=UPI001C2D4AC5|nr:E3 ubiquitin-protein ligase MARCH5 isoform X1 [Haplochromis burtoni]